MNNKKKIFFIMPFQDEFFDVYDMVKEKFEENFEFSHAGEEGNQQNILADIIQPIFESDIIIADLTGLNANVLYELGIAHTFNKKTIVITQDELSTLPFDLKSYRAKDYSTNFKRFADLLNYLEKNLTGAITGDIAFSNPVKDYIDINNINLEACFNNTVSIEIPNDEKGFWDFLADLEDATGELTNNIVNMTSDMTVMNDGISECTSEIERVNKTGGNGTASFVRKQSRKIATYIENYSKSLKEFNKNHEFLWDGIEKNILGLLENKIASNSENKESLIEYLKALYDLKGTITNNIPSIASVQESYRESIGFERTLNHSINNLDEDLQTYLNLMERTVSSIDKIISKSTFVVGAIDFEVVADVVNAEDN